MDAEVAACHHSRATSWVPPVAHSGHANLYGGVAIVDSTGVVRWSFVSRFAGDHTSPEYVVATLRRAIGKPATVQS